MRRLRRRRPLVHLRPAEAPAPAEKVLTIENGQEKWLDAAQAEAAGYTLIDLSDDWTPFIFAPQLGQSGQPLQNRYRRVFIGLANDQLDEDGQPLPPGMKNYLELYGIFPSFSVIRARFLEDKGKTCLDEPMRLALEGSSGSLTSPRPACAARRRGWPACAGSWRRPGASSG